MRTPPSTSLEHWVGVYFLQQGGGSLKADPPSLCPQRHLHYHNAASNLKKALCFEFPFVNHFRSLSL